MDEHNPTFTAIDGNGNHVSPHNLIFPILKETGQNQTRLVGTGFFITKIGHFVTARHVIQDVLDTVSGRQNGFIHALHFVEDTRFLVRHITNVSIHNSSDIAVGKMDYHVLNSTGEPLQNKVCILTTNIPKIGSQVCTYAYPESDRVFQKAGGSRFVPNYYSGCMMAHSESPRDRLLVSWPHFVTSISLKGGASGGPVFDETGRVFGVNCVGGIQGISYMARAKELLDLEVPEFPGAETAQARSVRALAKIRQLVFDPSIE